MHQGWNSVQGLDVELHALPGSAIGRQAWQDPPDKGRSVCRRLRHSRNPGRFPCGYKYGGFPTPAGPSESAPCLYVSSGAPHHTHTHRKSPPFQFALRILDSISLFSPPPPLCDLVWSSLSRPLIPFSSLRRRRGVPIRTPGLPISIATLVVVEKEQDQVDCTRVGRSALGTSQE